MSQQELSSLDFLIEETLKEEFNTVGLIFEEDEAILVLSDLFERRGVIIIVLGKRGSGKTAWAIRSAEIAQQYFHRKTALFQIEYPDIRTVYDLAELENGTFLVVDEAELFFHSRRSLSRQNVNISKLLAISRHKDLSLVFVTQSSNLVDKNIMQLADYLIIKEPSIFSVGLERFSFYSLISYAKSFFASLPDYMKQQVYLTQSDTIYNYLWRKFAHYTRYFPRYYVEAVIRQYSIIRAKNRLPKAWNERISKSFAAYDITINRIEHKQLSQLPDKFTPEQVAEILDVSLRTAYRLIRRWREAKLVKKVKRGVYGKIKKK